MRIRAHSLVYTHGGGRLGNQVLRFAHWIAWILEQDGEVEVRNFAFWPYARFFETWRRHPGCVYPLRADAWDEASRALQLLPDWARHRVDLRLQRGLGILGRLRYGWQTIVLDDATGETIDLAGSSFSERISKSVGVICAGWRIADWDALVRQQIVIRRLLEPARDYSVSANEFLQGIRQRHRLIIGVHMRQGDYRQWHEGRFYFHTARYYRWIQQVIDAYRDFDPGVVVVSDGVQSALDFTGLPVYQAKHEHWFVHWTILSLCDLVVSVPSTFSATAAFRGGLPIWPIFSEDQVMDPHQMIEDGLIGASRHPVFSLAVK